MDGSNSSVSDKEEEKKSPKPVAKIKRSVSAMIKQMEMTDEEVKYRMENFDAADIGKEYIKYLKCTKCNLSFQNMINQGKMVGSHPLLGVLMCNSCCDYYGDGDFSLDSEGEDKYCRWCGEGGTIFACSKCICGFCATCIQKHFGKTELKNVREDDDWICYFCNPKPLWYLRSICFLAKEAAKNKQKQLKSLKEGKSFKKKRIDVSESSSSDNSCSDSLKQKKTKRKRMSRFKEKPKREESSSSESLETTEINSKKRLKKSKRESIEDREGKDSTESETRNPKKKAKLGVTEGSDKNESDLEVKKSPLLEKLKSIWKLTQTATEVGLKSSRERLSCLSKGQNFKTMESLRKEHEELKSCMTVLVSTLNAAFNSAESIKEDLTFDTAKDERQIFQSQEKELKRFAKRYHREEERGDKETSAESDRASPSVVGLVGRRKRKQKEKRKVKKNKENSDGGLQSLYSDSGSEVKGRKGDEDKENQALSDESGPLRPLLKVKSFARMLDENAYDKNGKGGGEKGSAKKCEGSPVVIDLYDIDTDESESENQKKNQSVRGKENKKEPSAAKCKIEKGGNNEKNCIVEDRSEKLNGKNNASKEKEKTSGKKEGTESSKDENEKPEKSSQSEEKQDKLFTEPSQDGQKGSEEKSKNKSSDDEADKTSEKSSSGTKDENTKTNEKRITSDDDCENEPDDDDASKKKERNLGHESEKSSDEDLQKVRRQKKKKVASDGESDKKESENESTSTKNKNSSDESDEDVPIVRKKNCKKKLSDDEGEKKETEDDSPKKKNENDKSSDEEMSKKKEEKPDDKKSKEETRIKEKSEYSGNESESSEDDEKQNIKRRSRKKGKELTSSFEKFKQKREEFLKSSKRDKGKRGATKVLESSESDTEKEEMKKRSNKQSKQPILASSDEEDETKETKSEDEKENSNSEAGVPSSSTSSDEEDTRKDRRKRIQKGKSSQSSEEESPKRKKKRKKMSSSDSSGEESSKRKDKKGRKNIKKILKKDSLQVETKEALKNEEERKKRLKNRQKLFEEAFPNVEEGEAPRQIILDFDPETKEPLVKVHKKLVKKLKPHQIKGVKFMWDSCFESVQRAEEDSGSGCILAHCMGLGKTLQVITLVHTVMNHDLGVNTVLIVCPLSTVSNWIREFEFWLKNIHTDPITLYDLVKYKKMEDRKFYLEDWHKTGGVLVLSYDMFRNLTKSSGKKSKRKSKYQKVFESTLLDPGPDLVICDEGHLLKNEDTALSKCMSGVKTSRRIVLTGTPLQNNLVEYHCMVQFIKPNILGTKKEFCNRFVNPINNGQFEDSTESDVKIMKRRSHVLHSMLEGCVQRFDYSVLTPFLPEKHEYVLSISLTETQAKAYQHFINNLSAKSLGSSRTASLFHDYHSLQRIWTHPKTLLMQSERDSQREVLERDSEGSLKDFVVSSEEESSRASSRSRSGSGSESDSVTEIVPKKRILRSNANDPEVIEALEKEEKELNKRWYDEFYDEKSYEDLRESNKLLILFDLLKHCEEVKDKVLVFSQSLYSLDLIEYFLNKIDENGDKNDELLCGHQGNWVRGFDYFRLDGSTSSETRTNWCKQFNKKSNPRARLFLISTRAGGLGINLYGANRVVIFDASWNPSHDLQSIFRVYRFGQKKACFIYRFLSEATMEEKIYERQVTKLSLAHRVVDEHQIERHYTMGNLQELYTFEPTPKTERKIPKLPKDTILADILAAHKDRIVKYHEHDSLLENKQEEELSEEERKAAWKEYEEEKVQKTNILDPLLQQQLLLMQQAQLAQGGVAGMPTWSPAYVNPGQTMVNPMYLQGNPNIPLPILQRGMKVGVVPAPNENLESYLMRIFSKENWMIGQQGEQ